jgi:hypothetical protein
MPSLLRLISLALPLSNVYLMHVNSACMSLVCPTLCSAVKVGHLLGDSGDHPFDRYQTTRLSRLTRCTYTAIKPIPRQVGMGSECLDNDTLSVMVRLM